jgi:hypothetical protein
VTSPYRGRHLEQFRAQSEASTLDSAEVDLKADSFTLENKLDHAATLREPRHITDGQNSLFVERFDYFAKLGVLCGAYKKNAAAERFL